MPVVPCRKFSEDLLSVATGASTKMFSKYWELKGRNGVVSGSNLVHRREESRVFHKDMLIHSP